MQDRETTLSTELACEPASPPDADHEMETTRSRRTELPITHRRGRKTVLLHGVRIRITIEVIVIHTGWAIAKRRRTSIRLDFEPIDPPCDGSGTSPSERTVNSVLQFRSLEGGAEGRGRNIVSTLLNLLESLFEQQRQEIRSSAEDTGASEVLKTRERLLGTDSTRTASVLGTFDWPFLLADTGCNASCRDTVARATQLNKLFIRPVTRDGVMLAKPAVIPVQCIDQACDYYADQSPDSPDPRSVRQQLEARLTRALSNDFLTNLPGRDPMTTTAAQPDKAHARTNAIERMRSWCGEDVANQFIANNEITITKSGYTFTLRPNEFIKCRAKDGTYAKLCIHSGCFRAHPIDDIVFQILEIRRDVAAFLRLANVYSGNLAFTLI